MKPDFSPAQMQEMADTLRIIARGLASLALTLGNEPQAQLVADVVLLGESANALQSAASQAAEIERLRIQVAELDGKLTFNENGYRLVQAQKEQSDYAVEAAESRLLALREQVEGLPRYFVDNIDGDVTVRVADVLALFDPAQEQA